MLHASALKTSWMLSGATAAGPMRSGIPRSPKTAVDRAEESAHASGRGILFLAVFFAFTPSSTRSSAFARLLAHGLGMGRARDEQAVRQHNQLDLRHLHDHTQGGLQSRVMAKRRCDRRLC